MRTPSLALIRPALAGFFIACSIAAAHAVCTNAGTCVSLDSGIPGPLPVAAMAPLAAYTHPCNGTAASAVPSACASAYGSHLFLTDQSGQGIGANLYLQNNSDWAVFQTWLNYNPTEFQVYSSAARGKVTTTGGDNNVYWVAGTQFDSSWVGRNFLYLNGVQYRVSAYVSATQIQLANIDGTAVTLSALTGVDYFFVSTTTDSVCNVSGTTVTYVSGGLFTGGMDGGTGGAFTINGAAYTISSVDSTTQITLSSSGGTLTNATCHADHNVYDEVATIRIQSISGVNEENLTMLARAVADGSYPGQYRIQSQIAGLGVYLPIILGSGHSSTAYLTDVNRNLVIEPTGTVDLGGDGNLSQQSMTVASMNGSAATNYVDTSGALAGSAPFIASRSGTADTNVNLGIDVVGAGAVSFTNHAFGSIGFQVFGGSNGSDYVGTGNGTNGTAVGPFLSANGSDSNVNLRLIPKGTGAVLVTGHLGDNGSAPTPSTCGTGPTLSTGANDLHGSITTGTGATACTLTFNVARTNTPDCIVAGYGGGSTPVITAESTSLLTWTAAASTKYTYICMGY